MQLFKQVQRNLFCGRSTLLGRGFRCGCLQPLLFGADNFYISSLRKRTSLDDVCIDSKVGIAGGPLQERPPQGHRGIADDFFKADYLYPLGR